MYDIGQFKSALPKVSTLHLFIFCSQFFRSRLFCAGNGALQVIDLTPDSLQKAAV